MCWLEVSRSAAESIWQSFPTLEVPPAGSRGCECRHLGRRSAQSPVQRCVKWILAPSPNPNMRWTRFLCWIFHNFLHANALTLNLPLCCISYHSAWKTSKERFMPYLPSKLCCWQPELRIIASTHFSRKFLKKSSITWGRCCTCRIGHVFKHGHVWPMSETWKVLKRLLPRCLGESSLLCGLLAVEKGDRKRSWAPSQMIYTSIIFYHFHVFAFIYWSIQINQM